MLPSYKCVYILVAGLNCNFRDRKKKFQKEKTKKDSGNKVVVQRQGLGAGPDRMSREGLEEMTFELRPER